MPLYILPLLRLLSHFIVQDEHRAIHPKYFFSEPVESASAPVEETRGKKRARAEDFL